ncbi:MAG: pirin family protein [Planctomycetes bacterium]|nr:pirin family protein [Planctomycetota bacterium]
MMTVRRAKDRGHANYGWLDTRHTFSFADYFDPDHTGFRGLRVINEDRVRPGAGFETHGHRDMEILSYVLEGAIAHKDSMGHTETLHPGEVQRMTAGTGVLHSEFNPSTTDPLHFYQIWIVPDQTGLKPEYEQKAFPEGERLGRLRLVVSPDGTDGSLRIHADARMYVALLVPGGHVTYDLAPDRHAWVQVARGSVTLDQETLSAGDGAALTGGGSHPIAAHERSELLLFDLA